MFYIPKPPLGYPFTNSSDQHVSYKAKRNFSFKSVGRSIFFGIIMLFIPVLKIKLLRLELFLWSFFDCKRKAENKLIY